MDPTSPLLTRDDLAALVETGRELAAEVSLAPLLERILEQATGLTDSADGSVILHDDRRGVLYFAHAVGANASMLLQEWGEQSDKGIPLAGSKAGEVFTSGRSLIVGSVGTDPNHFGGVDHDTGKATQSMVCVPMGIGRSRVGVVQVLNRRTGSYSDRDLMLLEHFAAQAAIAVRNARLFDDLFAHMHLSPTTATGCGPVELLEELNRPAHHELVSILFADMRGFTQLTQIERRPEKTQELLNEFLSMLADTVVAHQGSVNKFLGDGVMALFRGVDPAVRAVECGAVMIDAFAALHRRWDEGSNLSLGFLDLGVGIATDTVMLGTIGSDRVRDFTAVGTAVVLAALLMDHAREGRRLLVDRMTYRAAKDGIAGFEGPEPFELKKPGQTIGHMYERYHVTKLHTGSGSNPPHAAGGETARPTPRADVFISYSHKDKPWLKTLRVHLKPYVRAGIVTAWDDLQIRPGDRWRDEIDKALAEARVAVLLVSPHFLDSDFIAANELPPLLAAAEARGATILWVPLSASSYDETDIGRYQATLDPARPIDSLTPAEQNQAFVSVCKAIKAAVAQ